MKYCLFALIFIIQTNTTIATGTPEQRLQELGINLPTIPSPIGNYAHVIRNGDDLYLTGKGPNLPVGGYMKGKLGKDLSIDQGKEASRLTVIHLLSVIKSEIGDLSHVEKIIKLNGAVNSTEGFEDHPKVIDGASDLLTKVFGEKIGKHARTVYGVNSLPMGIPVEIDMIVKIKKGAAK